jgi:phosphohistidine phosphatase
MLLLIRHAPAGDRIRWAIRGRADELRPLTAKGSKKFDRAAKILSKKIKCKFILTSEKTRGIQTAEILQRYGANPQMGISNFLGEEFDVKKIARLARHLERLHGVVALVGHEPSISQLLAYLLTGKTRPIGKMAKGAVACVEIEGKKARLSWLMTMEQLSGD